MTTTMPATFAELNAALDAAAMPGVPHAMDWPHRALHFQIMERAFQTLDRPLAELDALLPEDFRKIAPSIWAAIPGNSAAMAKVLRARVLRARAVFCPGRHPWDAVLALAESEIAELQNAWPRIRQAAAETGLATPADIDSAWIAARLNDVTGTDEAVRRMIYATLIRASRLPAVQEAGLLRPCLVLPPTLYAAERAVGLPDWLQHIHDAETQWTRAAIRRVWRTVHHQDHGAADADALLRLIETQRLSLAAARAVEDIKSTTWTMYLRRTRRALLTRAADPSRYATRLAHTDLPPKPKRPRTPRPPARSASHCFAMDAARTLTPPVALEAEALLTPETWPRAVAAMRVLGQTRGYDATSVENRIDRARQVLGRLAGGPVARLPRTEGSETRGATSRPARSRTRRPTKVPVLPEPLCVEVRRLLALRGYTDNATRSMIAELGKVYTGALKTGRLPSDPSLRDVAGYGARTTEGGQVEARRMMDTINLCAHPDYAAFLAALRAAGISLKDDPTATLFAATGGARSISALTRDWAWTHEHDLRPDKRIAFCRAVDQLDASRAIPDLAPHLPVETLGPLPGSSRYHGKRQQHARYRLPCRIEAEAEALDLDRGGEEWNDLIAGLHSLYRAAREAGLYGPEDDIDCATLLCSDTIASIERAEIFGRAAVRTAQQRTTLLQPDESRATPRDRWALLLARIRGRDDAAAGRPCLTPYYAVRRHALEDGFGPEEVTSGWARKTFARIGADRIARSTFRQGLRFLNDLRDNADIPGDLLPGEIDADLKAARRFATGWHRSR